MMKQTIKILGKNLNRLKKNDLEPFKKMFCKMKPPRGKMKIQNRHLKNKSAEEIAEKIVESYTARNGPSHVIKVLKKMNLTEIRIELQKDMRQARKKYKEKRSNAKVQVAEGDRAHLNNHTSQKKSSSVKAQVGVPTPPQTQREVNSKVPKPCSAQEDDRNKILKPKDNQEEPNNVPRKVGPQITKPDTSQDTSGILISLIDQNEGKHYMTKLEEGQKGTDYKVLKSNIKQEKQESFLEYREIEEFGNAKAIQKFRNSDLQEQSQNQGDPKDDVRIGEGIDEQPKFEATKVKLPKRQAQNRSMGKKQEDGQVKSPTGKQKPIQQAKKGGKHFLDVHRVKLIEKVTNVDPVLDDLLDEEILTLEQYDIVRKEKTTQDKMRELYHHQRSWGDRDKNKFKGFLKKHNPAFFRGLKGQNKKKKIV